MKLILREYISMLKESGELDKIIPDLLQNMGISPINRAQVGVRQFGIDVTARGVDPSDGEEKLFLFTIKPGHLTRKDWYSTPQSVKPSLDEIIEVYIPTKVSKKHDGIKRKLILCCGGDLKQEVQENWNGFIQKNESDLIEIEFWGADKLSILIEEYFLDEFLFQESSQKQIRKTLSLIGDNDYDLSDYYEFVDDTFRNLKSGGKLTQKKVIKSLRLLNLSISLVSKWAKEEKSFKKSFVASERLLLKVYKFLADNNYDDKKRIRNAYFSIYGTHLKISADYFINIQKHLYVKDSFFGYGADKYDYPLRTFEVIGMISTIGLDYINIAFNFQEEAINDARRVSDGLRSLLENNSSTHSPLFDRNIIEIVLGLKLLFLTDDKTTCSKWIESILNHLVISIQIGELYPIFTDLYDDLLSVERSDEDIKMRMTSISTIIPILFQWFIILDRKDLYKRYQPRISELYSHCDFQVWYPDKTTEEFMYEENSAFHSGITLSSIELPESFERFKELTFEALEWDKSISFINSMSYYQSILIFDSRHHKNPVPAFFWQELIPGVKIRSDKSGLTFNET